MFKYQLIGDNDYLFDIQGTILKNRGIKDVQQFLNMDKKVEHSYKLLKNIDKAVKCLDKHIENKSNFLIIVDPDVDGNTSACIIYQYLKMLDDRLNIRWVIHEDKAHGFKGIEIPKGTNCIIVPDSGSNDFTYHERLAKQGIDIIILDHHECDKESEHAIVVNPQICEYPNHNLSGAGIVFKFIQALDDYYWNDYADYFLDLVALGNIADSMSMTELETRYYVEKGLKEINNDFFRALIRQQEYSMKGKVNVTSVSFYISPLINSIIRCGSKQDKLDLFKAFIGVKELVKYKPRGSDETLVSLVDDMARRSTNIKAKQGRLVEKVVQEIDDKIDDEQKVVFAHDIQSIEGGVSGLIAMKICSRTKKPTIVLSEKNEKGNYKGSARGYDKGELKDFKAIVNQTGLFEIAQGHSSAFGLEIKEKNIPAAIQKLNELLTEYSFEDIYEVDFMIPANSMNDYIVKEITDLADLWGKGIEEPYIIVEKIPVKNAEVNLLGKNQDTISLKYNDITYMLFKKSEEVYNEILDSSYITLVGRANLNEYKGEVKSQLFVNAYLLED